MTQITLHHDDCREALRRMIAQGVRVHSVVTDPPYHLESVVKRFGKEGAAPAKAGADGRFARQSRGFMGKHWDGADADGSRIAQDPEFWALIYDILLPGGYVLAFSSPRTGHWQACAMELAGFVMHPFIGWAYGQGFPKAHAVGKAIDKAAGAEREVIDIGRTRSRGMTGGTFIGGDGKPETRIRTAAATPDAAEWEGWFYSAQSLKPALEPIYMAQKPFSEKNGFLNVLKHGVGAVNINGCRVDIDPQLDATQLRQMNRNLRNSNDGWGMSTVSADSPQVLRPEGRWPANLVHDGSPEVVAMFPEAPGQIARSSSSEKRKNQNVYGEMAHGGPVHEPRNDSGSAARFFNAFPIGEDLWVSELDSQPIIYNAKATSRDRVIQCLECSERFVGRPTCGCSGANGGPARTASHPTVKPVALMRWLCRLVTPPGGVVLDPFAGSGTTGKAARDEGFQAILVEREFQYMADIRKRLGLYSDHSDPEIEELIGLPPDVEALL